MFSQFFYNLSYNYYRLRANWGYEKYKSGEPPGKIVGWCRRGIKKAERLGKDSSDLVRIMDELLKPKNKKISTKGTAQ